MNPLKALLAAATLGLSTLATPVLADSQDGYIPMAMEDLKWIDLPGGIKIAPLWTDPKTMRMGQMVQFAPNSPGAMHKHTNAYRAVIISGASKHWVEGQTADDVPLQGPGDYWYQAGGQYHQDQFPSDEPTILYVVWDGPPDTQMFGE